jgi:hypothetical protein
VTNAEVIEVLRCAADLIGQERSSGSEVVDACIWLDANDDDVRALMRAAGIDILLTYGEHKRCLLLEAAQRIEESRK